jgi:hypothetical protein
MQAARERARLPVGASATLDGWSRCLRSHLGRLGLGVELVAAGDETSLVRVDIAGRKDEADLPLPGDLLNPAAIAAKA